MRTRCHLLGCYEADAAPCCERCGAYIYDPVFIEWGRLAWVIAAYYRVKRWTMPRCWGCNRRLWPWTTRHHDDFCSETCFDGWLPF